MQKNLLLHKNIREFQARKLWNTIIRIFKIYSRELARTNCGYRKGKGNGFVISAILLNGGYSEKDIKLNSFDIEEGVPMMDTSGENIFDGGEDSQSSQNIEVIKEGQSKKTIIVGSSL